LYGKIGSPFGIGKRDPNGALIVKRIIVIDPRNGRFEEVI
jgi:hypothetical protein